MEPITFTPREYDTLAWLAARYGSADVLERAAEPYGDEDTGEPEGYRLTLAPETLRDYWRELWEDNGETAQDVPPCAGGTLADKLRAIPRRPDHVTALYTGAGDTCELSICGDCLCLVANGDTPPELDEDATARYVAAATADPSHVATGSVECEYCGTAMRAAADALGFDDWADCEGWFSWSACDLCGSGRWGDPEPWANGSLGGTRYHAVSWAVAP